jgi:hypothetical protein
MVRRISRRSVSGGSSEDLPSDTPKSPVVVPTNATSNLLGENIGLSKSTDLQEQLDGLRDQFIKAMAKQQGQNVKYTAVQSLNKQLSTSYFKNLQVIIDISKLLSSYVEFLDIVKSQTSQLQVEMDKLGPSDFDYVKNLTTERIFSLNDEFKKSAAELKALYMQYNMKDEIGKIDMAEQEFKNTIDLADNTYQRLSNGSSLLSDKALTPSKPLEEQNTNAKPNSSVHVRKNAPKPNTSTNSKPEQDLSQKPDSKPDSKPDEKPAQKQFVGPSSYKQPSSTPGFSGSKPPTSPPYVPKPQTPASTKPLIPNAAPYKPEGKTVTVSALSPSKFGKKPLSSSNTKKPYQK